MLTAGVSSSRRGMYKAVQRLLLLAVLAILAMDATGLESLVTREACTSVQDTQPDGACPALCVRCACCAQPVVPLIATCDVAMSLPQPVSADYSSNVPTTIPADIFHVPKFASLTI